MDSEHINPWYDIKHYPIGSAERAEQAEELKKVLMYPGFEHLYDLVLSMTRSMLKSPEQAHDNAVIIRTMTLLYSDNMTLERKQAFVQPFQRSIDPPETQDSVTNNFPEPNSLQSEKMWQQMKDSAAKSATERKHWEYVSSNSTRSATNCQPFNSASSDDSDDVYE
jgi:hypothetical protein